MLCRLVVVLALSGADALNLGAAASRRSFITKAWLSARTRENCGRLCASRVPPRASECEPCCIIQPHATGRRRRRLARRRGARLRRIEGFSDPCRQGRHDWHTRRVPGRMLPALQPPPPLAPRARLALPRPPTRLAPFRTTRLHPPYPFTPTVHPSVAPCPFPPHRVPVSSSSSSVPSSPLSCPPATASIHSLSPLPPTPPPSLPPGCSRWRIRRQVGQVGHRDQERLRRQVHRRRGQGPQDLVGGQPRLPDRRRRCLLALTHPYNPYTPTSPVPLHSLAPP